jgi:septal ring factor EnvC (AmiA/AmiB activator)
MTRRLITTAIAALALCCAASSLPAQERGLEDKIKGTEDELQRLRREISEQRKKIAEIEKQEKDVSGYLDRLQREEQLMKRLLSGLEDKESMLVEQVDLLRGDLAENEAVYRHRLEVFSARLREIYKEGPRNMWQELLAAEDVPDLLQRYKFLSLITESDAAMITDVRSRKEEIERQEAELTELLHEVSSSRAEKESELQKLGENQKKRRSSLASLQTRKKDYERKAAELEETERKMQSLIDELEKQRLAQSKAWGDYGEPDFPGLKGRLPRPVEGSVSRGFGRFKHPEYGTVTFNTGIDIETRAGEPVRAVARGRIEYAGDLPGYGNCIIVNHGDGYYTLYAHLSRIFVSQGVQVERGTLVAETGRDTAGGGGTIHFEIRQSKKALDPAEWLGR